MRLRCTSLAPPSLSVCDALKFNSSSTCAAFHPWSYVTLTFALYAQLSVTFRVRARIHATFTFRTYLRVSFVVIAVHAQLYVTFAMRIRLRATFAIPFSSFVQWEDVNVELPASSKNKNSQAFLRFTWFMLNNIYSPSSMNYANLKTACEFSFLKLSGSSKVTFSNCTSTVPGACIPSRYLGSPCIPPHYLLGARICSRSMQASHSADQQHNNIAFKYHLKFKKKLILTGKRSWDHRLSSRTLQYFYHEPVQS